MGPFSREQKSLRQKTQIITIIQNLKGINVSNKIEKLRAEGAAQRQAPAQEGGALCLIPSTIYKPGRVAPTYNPST